MEDILKIYVIVLWLSIANIGRYSTSHLHLDASNSFQDLLLYINDNIDEDDGALLKNIKDHTNAFSLSLWKIQNKSRTRINTVFIKIPEKWKMIGNAITWQQGHEADFYVTKNQNIGKTKPFTLHFGNCCQPPVFNTFPDYFYRIKDFMEVIKAGQDNTSKGFEQANFVIVKGQSQSVVFLIEVSDIMKNIFDNIRNTVILFLKEIIEESDSVGIVSFNAAASVLSPTKIMDKKNRKSLITILENLSTSGMTNIPYGILKGIEVLAGNLENNETIFGSIIMLSSCKSNVQSPYTYDYVIDRAINKNIIVNVICCGTSADLKLNEIVNYTGGRYLFVNPNTKYLYMLEKISIKQSLNKKKMMEDTLIIQFSGGLAEVNLTKLDKYIGNDVIINVTFEQEVSNYIINLISPSGKPIQYSKVQSNRNSLIFQVFGTPEFGMYKIKIKSKTFMREKRQANTFSIKYTTSATPNSKLRIINPLGELSNNEIKNLTDTSFIKAFVDMSSCEMNENETVTINLTMITPSNIHKTMPMMDDGFGDDSVEDDKIFTKTLISKDLQEIGFYSFISNIEIYNHYTKESIKRTVDLGSMRVKAKSSKAFEDKVAPAKIEYVYIDVLNSTEKSLKIKIITTGNDGMDGNISHYEIRIKSSGGQIIINQKLYNQPKTTVEFMLTLLKKNVTDPFEISVRGIDDNNNAGEWSLGKFSIWNNTVFAKTSSQPYYTTKQARKIMFSILSFLINSIWTVLNIF